MIFPMAPYEVFGYQGGLVLGTLIGFGFGFVLERAGFGRAPMLAAQFYGTDTRVLKVMFTAIVTALLGVTVLAGTGVLDLAALTVPETFLGPQIAGGLLLGIGFIVSGYCPGTAVVAAGSGNWDGLVTVVGVMLGSLLFGAAYPFVEPFYHSGAMGVVRLPDALGIPQEVLAAGVLAMAAGAFLFAETAERFFARRRGESAPEAAPALRNKVLGTLGIAAIVGAATMALPEDDVARPAASPSRIGAMELARLLVERPASIHLVDLRDPSECARALIPGATCVPQGDPSAAFVADLPRTRRLVLYAGRDVPALPPAVRAWDGEIAVLEGGFDAFRDAFLLEPTTPADPTPAALEEYRTRSALHGFFTGAQAPAAPPAPAASPAPTKAPRGTRRGGGC